MRLSIFCNASLGWKILHNKGQLMLDFDDLLDKNTYYSSDQTVTSRTESWQVTMHHYIRILFTFFLDAKKKDEPSHTFRFRLPESG